MPFEEHAKRKGVLLCYPFEEKRLQKWGFPVITQPKLDGERCRYKDGELLSSSESIINSVPFINASLAETGLKLPELDGELYKHGMDFDSIHSIVSRTVNFHEDANKMQYHLFDLKTVDNQSLRLMKLDQLKPFLPANVHIVPWKLVYSFDELWDQYNEYIEQGFEGIIIRHPGNYYIERRSTHVMKFKPKKDDYYEIVGWSELRGYKMSAETIDKYAKNIPGGKAKTVEQLRYLIPGGMEKEPKGVLGKFICDGTADDTFSVGSGLTDAQRALYWKERESLKGKLVHVSYQHITPGKGVPRFPVFMEVLGE